MRRREWMNFNLKETIRVPSETCINKRMLAAFEEVVQIIFKQGARKLHVACLRDLRSNVPRHTRGLLTRCESESSRLSLIALHEWYKTNSYILTNPGQAGYTFLVIYISNASLPMPQVILIVINFSLKTNGTNAIRGERCASFTFEAMMLPCT